MLFGPGNSLILVNDFLEREKLDAFELELKEAKKFYKAVQLSELIEKQKKGKSGYFALCFKQARKNFQLSALPVIQEQELPCTLFLQPECVGTNRLPLLEEIAWFKKEFPSQISESQVVEWEKLILADHAKAEEMLAGLRKQMGSLPIQKIGPEHFYLKWGDLLDLNPKQFEFGLNLSSHSISWITDSKNYAESQLSRKLSVAYTAHQPSITEDIMMQLGFIGLVTECVGAVDRQKSAFNLPQWKF